MTCPLCILEHKTKVFYENDLFIVLDCLTCKVPMYVWKKHKFPTTKQKISMYSDAQQRFPDRKLSLIRRNLPKHFHFHCR